MSDLYIKIPVTSEEETKKVISHLRKLGYDYSNPVHPKVCGIIVGNGKIGGIISPLLFAKEVRTEMSVEEVLSININD